MTTDVPTASPGRRGAAWLLVTLALAAAVTALGAAELVVDLAPALLWTGLVLLVLGIVSATATTVVVARATGVSAPRTLGRALLAPFRFLLDLV